MKHRVRTALLLGCLALSIPGPVLAKGKGSSSHGHIGRIKGKSYPKVITKGHKLKTLKAGSVCVGGLCSAPTTTKAKASSKGGKVSHKHYRFVGEHYNEVDDTVKPQFLKDCIWNMQTMTCDVGQ